MMSGSRNCWTLCGRSDRRWHLAGVHALAHFIDETGRSCRGWEAGHDQVCLSPMCPGGWLFPVHTALVRNDVVREVVCLTAD